MEENTAQNKLVRAIPKHEGEGWESMLELSCVQSNCEIIKWFILKRVSRESGRSLFLCWQEMPRAENRVDFPFPFPNPATPHKSMGRIS